MDIDDSKDRVEDLGEKMIPTEDQGLSLETSLMGNDQQKRQNLKEEVRYCLIVLLIVAVVVGLLALFCDSIRKGYIGSFIYGTAISDYEAYLNDKYGEDEGFSSTDKFGTNGCPVFNAGFCVRVFTSKKSGKEFDVRYDTPDVYTKTVFSDQYYLAKYEDELDSYYREKYSEIFEDAIQYPFVVSTKRYYPYFDFNEKPSSFEEVVAVLNQYAKEDGLYRIGVNINVDYGEIDLGSISEGDFTRLRSQVRDLVKGNELDLKDVNLVVTMLGSGRRGTCPKPFKTNKDDSYIIGDNDEDKEIKNCYKTLYSIYSQNLD